MDSSNYKDITKITYDSSAKAYEESTASFLEHYLLDDAQLFLRKLPGKKILDLGSGPGRDAHYFKEQGYQPICIDISPAMVEICRKKGLEAQVMDLEHLEFSQAVFDGVWAYTSLLHLPKKHVPPVLTRISQLLVPQGMFYIGMREGIFEGLRKDEKMNYQERYFAYYTEEELASFLSAEFSVLQISRAIPQPSHNVYLNFLCKAKPAES